MKILIVKLTSMGDVLHLMPAITDLRQHKPDVEIDWLVEDSFSEIPNWHPAVRRVLKASTRRWRKFDRVSRNEYRAFKQQLRTESYDLVIDAQGLIKSAWIARLAILTSNGFRAGFSGDSIKESPAAWSYKRKIKVDRKQHAVTRLRQLFAGIFDYNFSPIVDYGLSLPKSGTNNSNTIFLFHGTTWASKHLPDQTWRDLRDEIIKSGYHVKLTWGNEIEKKRAQWIAQGRDDVTILPRASLTSLAQELSSAKGAIAVDTGLGHLSAALAIPTISLYGSTDATLTGAMGENQLQRQSQYACSPCLLKQCNKLDDQQTHPPCYDQFSANNICQDLFKQTNLVNT